MHAQRIGHACQASAFAPSHVMNALNAYTVDVEDKAAHVSRKRVLHPAHTPVKIPDTFGLQLLTGEGQGVPEVPQETNCTVPRDLPDAKKSEDVVYSICAEVPAAWSQEVSMTVATLGQAGGRHVKPLCRPCSMAWLQVCWCSRRARSAGRLRKGAACPVMAHMGPACAFLTGSRVPHQEAVGYRHCMACFVSVAHAGNTTRETAGQPIRAHAQAACAKPLELWMPHNLTLSVSYAEAPDCRDASSCSAPAHASSEKPLEPSSTRGLIITC